MSDESIDPILLPEEKDVLDETLMYRRKMIEDLFKDGVPDVKHYRIANEILGATDMAMLKRIELRQKQEQHQSDQEIITKAIELAKDRISRRIKSYKPDEQDKEVDVPDKYIPTDIVPGEDQLEPDVLDIDDFIKE